MASALFTAWGKPIPKGRPRMTRRGRVYTPQRTHDAERNLAEQYEGPHFGDSPVAMTIHLWNDRQVISIEERLWHERTAKLRGDIDNVAKLTLDALNGVAYDDDKQVIELHVYVH